MSSRLPTPAELNTLAGILGRLGSNQPGERDCAALMATKWIRSRGLNWSEILLPALPQPKRRPRGKAPPPPPPPPPHPPSDGWLLLIQRCLQRSWMLNDWEQGFLRDLRGFSKLSEKQAARLDAIAAKLGVGRA